MQRKILSFALVSLPMNVAFAQPVAASARAELVSSRVKGPQIKSKANTQPAQQDDERAEDKPAKFVRVSITPIEYSRLANDYVPTAQFKVGSRMRVAVLMTNTSEQPLTVARFGAFMHNRLRLVKDGRPVRYLHDVPKRIKASDENENVFVSPREGVLEPNRESRYDQLDLSEWCGHLQPGHYELTLRHRFGWKGKWVESNTVEFDIVP